MKKVYYLSTCDTCIRILREINLPYDFVKQDIKKEEVTVKQLEALRNLAGSYEALFSRRAKLYKERNLKDEALSEENYKSLILEHYTFLSRPVVVNGNDIFIGNSKKVVQSAKISIHNQ